MAEHEFNFIFAKQKLARAKIVRQTVLARACIEGAEQILEVIQFGDKSSERLHHDGDELFLVEALLIRGEFGGRHLTRFMQRGVFGCECCSKTSC